jgi:ABC-type glutathione transport system ATPase component
MSIPGPEMSASTASTASTDRDVRTGQDVRTDRTAAPALDARDLYRFFRAGEEETLALRGVTLRVERGETVAVVGPSGSGKSTLLACLAGLDEPASASATGRRPSGPASEPAASASCCSPATSFRI